jgi:dual oxidase
MGLASQIAEREDSVLCSDVRNNLFGPMEFSRRDLAALNIMRGRDNGLADYNMVRKCHGLPRIEDFSEINPYLNATDPVRLISFSECAFVGDGATLNTGTQGWNSLNS